MLDILLKDLFFIHTQRSFKKISNITFQYVPLNIESYLQQSTLHQHRNLNIKKERNLKLNCSVRNKVCNMTTKQILLLKKKSSYNSKWSASNWVIFVTFCRIGIAWIINGFVLFLKLNVNLFQGEIIQFWTNK